MLISKKKLTKLLDEADENGLHRGYKLGLMMGRIEKQNVKHMVERASVPHYISWEEETW